ncbi:unnamed protein product [Protopolystoma xenopodis]|uniref:Immunoglobulin I-set domain-containing protein n=1 Tax=Protopolystoma xenopodis TaxID=117903 RepID=A0A3S5FCQ4_9PLAT|nr:unnamed protein product [Protopolystoma xenopodis]
MEVHEKEIRCSSSGEIDQRISSLCTLIRNKGPPNSLCPSNSRSTLDGCLILHLLVDSLDLSLSRASFFHLTLLRLSSLNLFFFYFAALASRFNTTFDRGYAVLDFLYTNQDDSGEYFCLATNSLGQAQDLNQLNFDEFGKLLTSTPHAQWPQLLLTFQALLTDIFGLTTSLATTGKSFCYVYHSFAILALNEVFFPTGLSAYLFPAS